MIWGGKIFAVTTFQSTIYEFTWNFYLNIKTETIALDFVMHPIFVYIWKVLTKQIRNKGIQETRMCGGNW